MYKLILNDYRSHFKNTLKALWNDGGVYAILCMTIFSLPEEDDRAMCCLCLSVPCIVAYILSRMYGGCLSKTFFLCPMDAKGRRQYAKESYRLRIIIPTVIFFIGNILLLIFNEFDITMFLIRLFAFGCTAVSINIYCSSKVFTNKNTEISPFIGNYDMVNIWSNLMNLLSIIALVSMDGYYSVFEMRKGTIVLIGLILAWQFILTVIKVKNFYWQSIVVMELYK